MSQLTDHFSRLLSGTGAPSEPLVCGKLTRVVGLTLEASGCQLVVGTRCLVSNVHGQEIEAEVIGFDGKTTFLMPISDAEGLHPGAVVRPLSKGADVSVGPGLLGRVINGAGEFIDGKGDAQASAQISLNGNIINPLHRAPVKQAMDVGIKAINGLLTVGVGQRLGLFAGSGVGKSVLLGMMTRFTDADIVVVGLIGERGREVKEFIEEILGEEGLKRAIVIASPADDSPLMRLRAAMLCTRIAEYFRDQGQKVLLLMDSLTRYAQAQREIALSVGEPPVSKGYPPSVFAKIPQLVERAGNGEPGGGSITAFYTVLTEGDDLQDPVADSARAILDGHIVLSRVLAEEGHYPAIDVEKSISRVMPQVVSPQHLQEAQRFKQLYSRYQQSRDLINVGAYAPGSDPELDRAIELQDPMRQFLQQGLKDKVVFANAQNHLKGIMSSSSEASGNVNPATTLAPGQA